MTGGEGHRALAVTRLTLSDFRCYAHLRLETDARSVVLTGPNGAGKTNILEALSFLAPGRGLRRARLAEATRRQVAETGGWAVAARLEGPAGGWDIGTGRLAGSERRVVRIDGRSGVGQADLAQVASVLWLTPAMDRLFGEGASGRRRFLDRLVLGLDPAHGPRAVAYEHAMRERNRLMATDRADGAWLDALEETMARQGVAMIRARQNLVSTLNDASGDGIGSFPAARLTVTGDDPAWTGADDGRAIAGLRDALAAARRIDAERGAAGIGPHRSDLVVHHAGKGLPAMACSTGEQKAVLVAIILGQARVQAALRGFAPLLLLDEISAHLDRERRAALFDELGALSAQSWMTGTDGALFAELGERGQYFQVEEAVVTAA